MDIKKLEKWVNEHPDDADALTINMTTGKEFTIRDVLVKLKKAEKEGIKISEKLDKDDIKKLKKTGVDEEDIEITGHIEKWLKEV